LSAVHNDIYKNALLSVGDILRLCPRRKPNDYLP